MKKILVALAAMAILSACNQPSTAGIPSLDSVSGQPAPQAQHGSGFDVGSAAIGALGGAVVGNMMGKSSAAQPQTVIVDRRPIYNSAPSYYGGRTTTTTTTTKRSLFGNNTITRTVTRRR